MRDCGPQLAREAIEGRKIDWSREADDEEGDFDATR